MKYTTKYTTENPKTATTIHPIFRNWFSFTTIEESKDWSKEWLKNVEAEPEITIEIVGDLP